jgi:protein involved in polysaccharide export with SLBB domain
VLERKPGTDIALKPMDTLKVFPRSAFRDLPKATISGEVRMTRQELQAAPKSEAQATIGKAAAETRSDTGVLTYEIHPGARVADLVKMAGGLTRLAYLNRAEIVRVDANRNFQTIYFHLGKAMAGDPKENVALENEDHVRIHSVWETTYRKNVSVAGEVNNPGDFVLTGGMRLSDLLFKAGGFKESAYVREAELVRREVTEGGALVRTETLVVSPERAIAGDNTYDVPLREYDYLFVRAIPDWRDRVTVDVRGEVRFPGTYTLRKGERLSSLINRAGGFTPEAYLNAAQFTRVSTQKTQQEAINRFIEELEMAIAEGGQQMGAALDKEDLESNRQLMQARNALHAQLKKVKAKGRVIIHLAESDRIKGTVDDILLEDGDRLEVPEKMNVVNVVGRVYNPTGVVYDPANDTVQYYLHTVGGPTQNADADHIFLLKANGSVVSSESAKKGFFVSGNSGLMTAKVQPGDSVIVPEKVLQVRLMKDVKDITQILMQIAVTAGVLIALF